MKQLDAALLGSRLRVLREQMELNSDDFSERVGIPGYTYLRYERGESQNLPFEHMARIANVLGITLDDIAELGGILELEGSPSDPVEQVVRKIRNLLNDLDEPVKSRFVKFYLAQAEALDSKLASLEMTPGNEEKMQLLPESFRRRYKLAAQQ